MRVFILGEKAKVRKSGDVDIIVKDPGLRPLPQAGNYSRKP